MRETEAKHLRAAAEAGKREGAREALNNVLGAVAVSAYSTVEFHITDDLRDRIRRAVTQQVKHIRDREYPAPEPPRVVLSDGSAVTREIKMGEVRWCRSYANVPERLPRRVEATEFPSILNDYDTGADFDALKAFAAARGET